jgi:hypothetical protein
MEECEQLVADAPQPLDEEGIMGVFTLIVCGFH